MVLGSRAPPPQDTREVGPLPTSCQDGNQPQDGGDQGRSRRPRSAPALPPGPQAGGERLGKSKRSFPGLLPAPLLHKAGET